MHTHGSDIPLLAQVTRLQFQLMHQFLASIKLYPGQFFVLHILANHPEGLSQKIIGKSLLIKPSSVNQIIVNLEKAGYVSRTPDEKDKRVIRVTVTEEGNRILALGKEKFDLIQDGLYKGISREDRETFDRIATQMRDNLMELQ